MSDFVLAIAFILVLVLFMFFHKLHKFYKAENIYKKMKWICEKATKNRKCADCDNLLYYLNNQTHELKIPYDYQLLFRTTEEAYASVILERFKKSKLNSLFRQDMNSLTTMYKEWYKISDLDYFMLSLFGYLEVNAESSSYYYSDKIYKRNMHKGDSSYSYYNLTDFGRAYFKLFLITALYCENNANTKPFIRNPQAQHIKSYLDTNEICFWRYRP